MTFTIKPPVRQPLQPSRQQIACMRAYVETGSQKEAAHKLEISVQTLKNHLNALYERLGVGGAMDAVRTLGWVVLPDDPDKKKACGWVGYCSRPFDHKGPHGGMRSFDPNAVFRPTISEGSRGDSSLD